LDKKRGQGHEEENTQNAPPSAKAEMNRLLAELGPDFKATWETVKNTDPASDDGEVLYAALDRLSDNCFDSYPFPVPPKASPA
jgi:hypothetical protein